MRSASGSATFAGAAALTAGLGLAALGGGARPAGGGRRGARGERGRDRRDAARGVEPAAHAAGLLGALRTHDAVRDHDGAVGYPSLVEAQGVPKQTAATWARGVRPRARGERARGRPPRWPQPLRAVRMALVTGSLLVVSWALVLGWPGARPLHELIVAALLSVALPAPCRSSRSCSLGRATRRTWRAPRRGSSTAAASWRAPSRSSPRACCSAATGARRRLAARAAADARAVGAVAGAARAAAARRGAGRVVVWPSARTSWPPRRRRTARRGKPDDRVWRSREGGAGNGCYGESIRTRLRSDPSSLGAQSASLALPGHAGPKRRTGRPTPPAPPRAAAPLRTTLNAVRARCPAGSRTRPAVENRRAT